MQLFATADKVPSQEGKTAENKKACRFGDYCDCEIVNAVCASSANGATVNSCGAIIYNSEIHIWVVIQQTQCAQIKTFMSTQTRAALIDFGDPLPARVEYGAPGVWSPEAVPLPTSAGTLKREDEFV